MGDEVSAIMALDRATIVVGGERYEVERARLGRSQEYHEYAEDGMARRVAGLAEWTLSVDVRVDSDVDHWRPLIDAARAGDKVDVEMAALGHTMRGEAYVSAFGVWPSESLLVPRVRRFVAPYPIVLEVDLLGSGGLWVDVDARAGSVAL